MASIHMDVALNAPAEAVWQGLSAFGEAHRVFVGVLSDCRPDGPDVRIVTFANGLVVREQIVAVDASRRRLVYTVVSGGFDHYNMSMQVVPGADHGCRFVWTCDVLPHEATERIRPLMDAGIAALKRRFEGLAEYSGGR